MRSHSSALGARRTANHTTFTVWAPIHSSVDVVLEGPDRTGIFPMATAGCGYWKTELGNVPAGTRYRFRLNGRDDQTYPDPASRFQPSGVHGPSEVVDPTTFRWQASAWNAPPLERLVLYELHVGTFTTNGTFLGAIERLPYLRDLGVTAIEIMPVAEFPGRWNWGYDGAALFAPSRAYGRPDDLRALIDAAHLNGLAVILDVVYNHFGPDGAYATAFSDRYFTNRHRSPWGQGVNLDGPGCEHVRRFFIENALHWVLEYRVDGLRLDATHAMHDESERHFIAELTSAVRAAAGEPVLFIAEDEREISNRLHPVAAGGWGLDGMWADEFHHEVRVHVARDREGYFARFSGQTADIAARVNTGRPGFVFCIQNHDQVGNRADGSRLSHAVDRSVYLAASTLLLLAPETPLLFMGQEWAASTPFQFFTDHAPEIGAKVTAGRRDEFRQFSAFSRPEHDHTVPDPQDPGTFERSRLDWGEQSLPAHAGVVRLYRRLLALRREINGPIRARALDEHTIALEADAYLTVIRLSGAGCVRLGTQSETTAVFSTEDPEFTDDSIPVELQQAPSRLRFARPGAVVLRTGESLAPRGPEGPRLRT